MKKGVAVVAVLALMLGLGFASHGRRRRPPRRPAPPPPVVPAPAPPTADDDAVAVAAGFPSTMPAGSSSSASVTMRNTGTSTWTRDGFKLGGVDDSDPFAVTRVYLPDGAAIPPGGSHAFTFALTAPSAPGTYRTDWRMVHEGVRWFGVTAARTITVTRDAGTIDASTLDGKMLAGYQGWFLCPGDGSPADGWFHWFRDGRPDAAHLHVDFWPDTSELGADELFDTNMAMPDGSTARVFSSFTGKTVHRHFRWMRESDIDGVWLQRFSSELRDPRFLEIRDTLTGHVRAGAEAEGRVFAIMYDISGHPEASLVEDLKSDWAHMVDALRVTESSRYLRHAGRPALVVWGFGYPDRPGTPDQARALIRWFREEAPERQRVTLVGGVPGSWRTLTGDSRTDPAWTEIYRSFDMVSPWTVGRYVDDRGADGYRSESLVPDKRDLESRGRGYMPVIFPGFSWHNLLDGPVNQIPRRGGRFFWRQAYNAIGAGCRTIFIAMFDELDEGTAIFKTAPTAAQQPSGATLVPLDIDGHALPSDWYMRLAGEASRMLRGERPLSPVTPTP